jgi:Cytochrome P450
MKKGNTLKSSFRSANMHQQSSNSSWKLEKPDKSNILLNFSLTNANGEVWERQRPIIQKAFAVSIVRRFSTSAAKKSLHEYLLQQRDLQQKPQQQESSSHVATMPTTPIKLDARHLSWNIAIDTMAVAVVSSKYAARLRGPLEPLYGPSLITNRNQQSERHVLKRVVTSILQDIMLTRKSHGIKTKSNHPCCLAESLLVYYKDDSNVYTTSSKETHDAVSVEENGNSSSDDDEGVKCATAKEQYLTFDEIVCNCHSALLAGIQSIATILTGALAHLAEHYEYQEQCRIEAFTKTSKMFAKSIVNETIRILPPVATLPRTFKCPSHQQECPRKKSGISIGTALLSTDNIIQIDILAMAHSNTSSKSSSIDPEFSSWKFCPSGGVSISNSGRHSPKQSIDPMVPKRSNGNTPRAAPWSLGSRSCPAGMISVEVIAEVLQELTRSTYTWSFWDPTENVTSPTGRNGWISQVSYRPTLCYPLPLFLKMVPNNSMVAIP